MNERFKEDGYEVFIVKDGLPEGFNERLKSILLSEGTPSFCTKISSSSNTVVFKFDCDGKTYLYKQFLCRDSAEGIKSIFKGSRAKRANDGALMVESAGLHTPIMCCYGQKVKLFNTTSFMVTEFLDDALNIYEYLDSHKSFKELRSFMKCLGRDVGKMHRASIIHGDLRPGNIMVIGGEPVGEFKINFIDNERNIKFKSQAPDKLIIKNLVQLNMLQRSKVKFSLRAIFLKNYLLEVSDLVKSKKELVREVSLITEARMSKAKHGGLYN